MRKLIILLALGAFQLAMYAQTNWTVDFVHSSVKFTVTHLVISEVEGVFKTYSGTVTSTNPDFADATIDFEVDVKSINTDNESRDKHLKSADFFDAEKYPQITFKSTSFKKLTGNNYELIGNLTMHGITKSVKFTVIYGGTVDDGYGHTKAGFKATTTIDRFDYDLKWNAITEAGSAVVSKEVTISVKLELLQVKK
jgi:polyisoprenoid-binding protein YceI